MRAPARAAGLSDLQGVPEAGFDAFGAIGGAEDFIRIIETRERAFVSSLFSARPHEVGWQSSAGSILDDLPSSRRGNG